MSSRDIIGETAAYRPANSEERCPECDGQTASIDGETVCVDCGLVVAEDWLDRGPEWRSFETASTPARRTGTPMTVTRHDRGLTTEIGFDSIASGRKRRQLGRLRREHGRAQFRSKAERNLAHALGEIARMTSALDLPRSVHEQASVIFRRAQAERLLLGRSIEAIAAGSVYASCRCAGVTRSLGEVAEVARCPREKVEMGYSVLNRELGLATVVTAPTRYVSTVASAVDAPPSVRKRAFELADRATEHGLANGCHPGGVAAACVYLAGQERGCLYTQQALAEVAYVTTTTLRKRYQELNAEMRSR